MEICASGLITGTLVGNDFARMPALLDGPDCGSMRGALFQDFKSAIARLTSLGCYRRMNFIDYLILAIVLLSLFVGYFRGFIGEAISLISWLGGLWLAWHYAYVLEPHLGGLVAHPPASTWAARTLMLLAVLVIGWIIAGIVAYFANQSGISLMLDRLLGMLFGAIRGMVLVAIFVMLAKQVQLDRTDWWQSSRFMPIAAEVSDWVKGFADSAVSERRHMHSEAAGA